jgi:PPOX class probable F420-dependent enzyme
MKKLFDMVPAELQNLLKDETKAFAALGTIMKDGSPQVTPVWFDTDGEFIFINTARGRLKDINMQRDPRIALAIIDPENSYNYLQIRGRVVESTEQGGDDYINKLSHKYGGQDYHFVPGEIRVTYKILAEHVSKSR